MNVPIALVVARARNGVIGRAGGLPWRLSTDLKRYKERTLGKPMLMGRKTWDSLPKKPLPGRENIVVTRDTRFTAPGAWVFSDLTAAIAAARTMAEAHGAEEVSVVGGAQLYGETLPMADRLHITEVDVETEGDALFPTFDESAFIETARDAFPAGPKDDHPFVIRTLTRRHA